MIRSIHLQNFKKHRDFRADFDSGLAAVTGDNFAGKSTLLKGILFALLGPTATGHKAERIPTRGSEGSTSAMLEISIPVHGDVKIERTLKGAKVWAKDGTLLANGTTPVVKLIEEAYGMSAADLQLLMYSKQGQSQALLEFGATALQKTIERLAKSDMVDKVLELVGKDVTRMEGELTGLGEVQDLGALRESVLIEEELLANDKGHLQELREELAGLEITEASLRQRYDQAVSIRNKLIHLAEVKTSYEKDIRQLSASIQEANTTLEGFEPDLEEKVKVEQANIDSMQNTWTTRKQRLDQAVILAARMAKLIDKRDTLEKGVEASDAVAGQLEAALKELTQLREESSRLERRYFDARKVCDDARAAVDKGVCHECQRPFNQEEQQEAIKRHSEAQDLVEEIYREQAKVKTPFALKEAEVKDLEKAYNPAAAALLDETVIQVEDANADLAAALKGFSSIPDLRDAVEQSKAAMDRARSAYYELTSQLSTRTSLQNKLSDLHQRLDKAFDALEQTEREVLHQRLAESPDELQKELQNSVQELRSRRAQENLILPQLRSTEMRLAAAEAALTKATQAQHTRQTLITEIDLRKRLQNWLRKSRADLMIELWDNMLAYASHLISNTTSGELSRVYREDGELMVDEQGDSVAVTELSGAQRNIVGLAIRIAMSRVFYGSELFLLLDEVTDACDDNMAARVAGMLQGLDTQIVMVTHRSGDSVNAANVLCL